MRGVEGRGGEGSGGGWGEEGAGHMGRSVPLAGRLEGGRSQCCNTCTHNARIAHNVQHIAHALYMCIHVHVYMYIHVQLWWQLLNMVHSSRAHGQGLRQG